MTQRSRHPRHLTRRHARARLVALTKPAGETADTEAWRTTIRRHPWAALAIGAGVGVLLGLSPKLRNSVLMSLLHLTK